MAIKVENLTRKFKYDSMELDDINPSMTPEEIRDVYSANFPELVSASIEGPERKGNVLFITFRKAVGSKG